MLSPKELDKFKRKLRHLYSRGAGGVSISVNSVVEVFMWCAYSDEPQALCLNIAPRDAALYVAYESKIWRPSEQDLIVEVEIDKDAVAFEREPAENSRSWSQQFRGLYVRAVEFGDLPCEDCSSCCLRARQKVRDFRLVGKASFTSGGYHLEPLRLTLEAL